MSINRGRAPTAPKRKTVLRSKAAILGERFPLASVDWALRVYRSRRRFLRCPPRTTRRITYSIDEKVADGISGCTRKGPRVSSLGPSKVSTFRPLDPESSQRNVSR
jgi:hypothetical protein